MTPDERQLISDLFERMRGYRGLDKDRDAEVLINQSVRANADAPYMLVQSVLVQEQALQAANSRVLELEEQVRSMEEGDRPRSARPGSFLGGGRWGSSRGDEPRSSVPQVGARATPSAYDSRGDSRAPWSQSAQPPQQQPAPAAAAGGGFMRSALTTAAGVAGGMLLASSISSMLGGGAAHANPAHGGEAHAESAKYVDEADNDPGAERAAYENDGNDPGFDSGDGGLDI